MPGDFWSSRGPDHKSFFFSFGTRRRAYIYTYTESEMESFVHGANEPSSPQLTIIPQSISSITELLASIFAFPNSRDFFLYYNPDGDSLWLCVR